MKISALILAAGSGSRIGKPKLMLEYGGKSFLKIIAEKIKNAGINDIICVVGDKSFHWAKENVPDIEYALNPDPEDGMISSVFFGIQKMNDCDGILIIPVDHPFVMPGTFKFIIAEAIRYRGCIVKPRYREKSGHPVIIPSELKEIILQKDFSAGLDVLIRESGFEQKYIEVEDRGVIKNINTYEDLIR